VAAAAAAKAAELAAAKNIFMPHKFNLAQIVFICSQRLQQQKQLKQIRLCRGTYRLSAYPVNRKFSKR